MGAVLTEPSPQPHILSILSGDAYKPKHKVWMQIVKWGDLQSGIVYRLKGIKEIEILVQEPEDSSSPTVTEVGKGTLQLKDRHITEEESSNY